MVRRLLIILCPLLVGACANFSGVHSPSAISQLRWQKMPGQIKPAQFLVTLIAFCLQFLQRAEKPPVEGFLDIVFPPTGRGGETIPMTVNTRYCRSRFDGYPGNVGLNLAYLGGPRWSLKSLPAYAWGKIVVGRCPWRAGALL